MICNCCNVDKPTKQFHWSKVTKSYYSTCKECRIFINLFEKAINEKPLTPVYKPKKLNKYKPAFELQNAMFNMIGSKYGLHSNL